MHAPLHIARKVQIDIWRFIPVKTEERLKRDVVAVTMIKRAANRTVFVRQIEAGTD